VFLVLAALRFQLLEQALSSRSFLKVLGLGTLGFCAFVVVVQFAATNTALLAVGLTIGTVALATASLHIGNAWAARNERMRQLSAFGRFSAELAHNLKNPVAAIKGAAQLLKQELKQHGSIERQSEFIELVLEQTERVQSSLEQYQQLGRVQPVFKPIQLNQVIREVMKLPAWTVPGVAVRLELEESLPSMIGDARLVGEAIENLVSNALEAMCPGGILLIRTKPDPVDRLIVLSVEDSGIGMDARTQERAFDDFFTTKPHGMGMGLAFVRRVVDAHGGRVSLYSHQGRGTTVRVQLPSA
jgi:signal transduction histidine kinase